MKNNHQAEELLRAWVLLTGTIKNCRITKGLVYNEAIIMLLLYSRYQQDGIGIISLKEITTETKMLKSLVNRTIKSLEKKGMLCHCTAEGDKRKSYVRCVEEQLPVFLKVHNGSLTIAQNIIDLIGTEDAEAFIRIAKKINDSGYEL